MDSFAAIVNGFYPLTINAKLSILDVCFAFGPKSLYGTWKVVRKYFEGILVAFVAFCKVVYKVFGSKR